MKEGETVSLSMVGASAARVVLAVTTEEVNEMHGMPVFPGEMRIDLRLSAEGGGRLVKVTARTRTGEDAHDEKAHERAPRKRPREVVPVFLEAVDLGIFHGPKEGQRTDVLYASAREVEGERIDSWEWMTPALEVEAFAVLARMLWSAGTHSLCIAQNAPEERLTVRALDEVPKGTDRIPHWPVENHLEEDAKNAVVLVCFEHAAPPEIVRAVHAVLRAWGAVAAFGGFTGGTSFPTSEAVLSEVGTELRSEVFASFEALHVGRDAWSALWEGLCRIHKDARITRVEMR